MSDSLQPHELQQDRLPCVSLSPRVCSDSCPLSRCCHPTFSSYVVPFSSCPQSFPASSFPMSRPCASGGQSIGTSASVLAVNIQGWLSEITIHESPKDICQCRSYRGSRKQFGENKWTAHLSGSTYVLGTVLGTRERWLIRILPHISGFPRWN